MSPLPSEYTILEIFIAAFKYLICYNNNGNNRPDVYLRGEGKNRFIEKIKCYVPVHSGHLQFLTSIPNL